MSVKMRQRVERNIARRLILDGLAAGYTIKVHNGEELLMPFNQVAKQILSLMFSVDEEHLLFYKDDKKIGWVLFVYGNDGWDVISDYSTNLEDIMAGARKVSDTYQ
jgi:hypothetical protein